MGMHFIYNTDILKYGRQPNLYNFSTVQSTLKPLLPCGSCSYLIVIWERGKHLMVSLYSVETFGLLKTKLI